MTFVKIAYIKVRTELQMESKIVNDVEKNCRECSFLESTEKVIHFRKLLKSFPSEIIQARIEFDSLCNLDLTELKPIQIKRVSSLKRELIKILLLNQ